jgi:hypothetical protein
MNKGLWTVAVSAGLAVSSCGGGHGTPTTSNGGAPSDFAEFVNQQVQSQPAFGTTPAATGSLTGDLGLDNATAFGSVAFGGGDALPSGTNQASVACTQAGYAACNPATSADLNSNLN